MTVSMKARKEKKWREKKLFIPRTLGLFTLSYTSGVVLIISAMF